MSPTRRDLLRNGIALLGVGTLSRGAFASGWNPAPTAALPDPDFYWGIGIENCWIAQINPAKDGSRRLLDVYLQMQHYEKWKADLQLASAVGVNCIRYSVPWYRSEPSPSTYDWSCIDGPIQYLVNELKIIPVLDIIHYGTPAWMEDGIADDRFSDALSAYTAAMATHFRGIVNHYTLQNEPQVNALFCGGVGRWPPYEHSPEAWSKLGVKLAKSAVQQERALREAAPESIVISAEPFVFAAIGRTFFQRVERTSPAARDLLTSAAIFPSCLSQGRVDASHPMAAFLQQHGIPAQDIEWFQSNFAEPDIYGVNYYPEIENQALKGDYTTMPNLSLEEAAHRAAAFTEDRLRFAYGYYRAPIYLTETSAGLTAEKKTAYMEALYNSILTLRGEGIPIRGLNWWPLFETIQWDYRENPSRPLKDFIYPGGWNNGLYTTESGPGGDLRRVHTWAADTYRDIIARDNLSWGPARKQKPKT